MFRQRSRWQQRLHWKHRLANTTTGVLLFFGTLAPVDQAGTITIDSTTITAATSDCDLAAAIRSANSNSAQEGCTIVADGSTIQTILLSDNTITLDSSLGSYDGPTGLPSITSNIGINGGSVGSVIARDPAATQHFRILHVAGSGQLTLSSVTIQGGEIAGRGGGIYVKDGGVVVLNQSSSVSGNQATIGGGISARQGSQVQLTESTINNNTATDFAGGLYAAQASTVTLVNSSIANNRSLGTTYGGGGLYKSGWNQII